MKQLNLGSPDNPLDALYFGIGLGTTRGLSYELPLDLMTPILAAEGIKRNLGLRRVDVLIADQHMKETGHDPSQVDSLARERLGQVDRIRTKLGLDGWNVHLASDITSTSEYQEIQSEIPFLRNPYVRMELADMEWFRRRGIDIKLGWRSSATDHDEGWFDSQYQQHVGSGMTFPYTRAGRTIDGNAVPPYSHVGLPGNRLLLRNGEDVPGKFQRMPKAVQKHYGHLTNLYADLGYPVTGGKSQEIFRNREMIPGRIKEMCEAII
ncbi:MAG: hypothetical protein GF368_00820 [Candidatus Aenigmarchaeota archaeon]|nr:hypothetical protein [Candidatus Aenigmarchaeota archaeon]